MIQVLRSQDFLCFSWKGKRTIGSSTPEEQPNQINSEEPENEDPWSTKTFDGLSFVGCR